MAQRQLTIRRQFHPQTGVPQRTYSSSVQRPTNRGRTAHCARCMGSPPVRALHTYAFFLKVAFNHHDSATEEPRVTKSLRRNFISLACASYRNLGPERR